MTMPPETLSSSYPLVCQRPLSARVLRFLALSAYVPKELLVACRDGVLDPLGPDFDGVCGCRHDDHGREAVMDHGDDPLSST